MKESRTSVQKNWKNLRKFLEICRFLRKDFLPDLFFCLSCLLIYEIHKIIFMLCKRYFYYYFYLQ